MRRPWWLILVLGGLLSLAFAGHDGDELERNRRLLARWKTDADHYARLQRDLRDFYALPADRQEQIRDIDRQLHDADPADQARLWSVLERYHDWIETLPEEERQAVLQASDKVAVIRGLRQREWVERLPKAIREDLDKLPPDKRIARITELKLQERQQRVLWQRPVGRDEPLLQPKNFGELPTVVQTFLERELLPNLSKPDGAELGKVEGSWPEYPKRLVWLADRYLLPEGPLGKITTHEQLPEAVKERLKNLKKPKANAIRGQGRWPEYALSVSEALRGERGLPPLGSSKADELPREVKEFVTGTLLPKLTPAEARDLSQNQEGRWPDYPRRLVWLARKYHVVIPRMSLPGPPEMWEAARVARQELAPEEQAAIEAVGFDLREGGLDRIRKTGLGKPPRGGAWDKMMHER